MAQNTTITLAPATWTQLTDADAAAVTIQNKSDYDIYVHGAVDATAPTTFLGSIKYGPGEKSENMTLANVFLGLTSPDRLYAYSKHGGEVFISHA